MSDPEIGLRLSFAQITEIVRQGVNSTQVPNDFLGELLAVTKEIRDLLRQKADQENKSSDELDTDPDKSEDPPEEADPTTAPIALNTAIVQIGTGNSWPNDETIAKYRDRCAKHKSELVKVQVELGCFVAHLGVVGGNKEVIEKAESLRKVLLDPVQCLEKAFHITPDGRPNAINEVQMSFDSLYDFIRDFARSPHQEDALYPYKVVQWNSFTFDGWSMIYGLLYDSKFVECLEFIHNVFLSKLEMAMGDVVEALATFEEKSATEFLATQKIRDYEKWCAEYMKLVFPPTDELGEPGAWLEPDESEHFRKRLAKHRILCNEMWIELDHLVSHYIIIGGDKVVIDATNLLKKELLSHSQYLEYASFYRSQDFGTKMRDVIQNLLHAVICFQSSLYHQKHAFYFRKVKQWVACLWIGAHRILRFLRRREVSQCMSYVHNTFLSEFEQAMIGITHGEQVKLGENMFKAVPEELRTFGKESLPKFLVDEMERDTTRYVNLTTIATFFSSVTATTLQLTYAETDSVPSNSLRGVVNLFWFLSLVFSVSSGVNSLLGLTWRKSSIYDYRVPPKLIYMWFDKAPMLFLIIAAIAFVIGLNLFAYLSLQPRYVSFATNILTGLHGVCLLSVTAWFIYQFKHDSVWAGWIRTVMKSITIITEWIGTGLKWIWKLVKRPYEKYKQNLHLQRNIYWAFGIDNRVLRLNLEISGYHDRSGPYLISKLIRRTSYLIKRCWLVTKKTLSDLSRTFRVHICVSSPTGRTGDDIEMGESVGRKETEAPEEISSETLAFNEFRKSLQTVFIEADQVDSIMCYVWICNIEEDADQYIGRCLWGYPALVKKYHEDIRPALIEAREKRRRESEMEGQQETTTEHVDNVLETVVVEDKDDSTSVPPQRSLTAPSCDGSAPLVMTQTDIQPDSQAQPDDHPPICDEGSLLTATSASTEALEPTTRDPDLQSDIGKAAISPNEIEEVPSTSENNNEGLRTPQGKEDLLE